MTAPTLKVLGVFLSSAREELTGVEIGRVTKLASGTLYPILFRLEGAGWLESRWETDIPQTLGRPRRRFYRMSPLGARNAQAAFKDLQPAFWGTAWA